MNDILFEDLYKYTNKYYKDVAARSARPITKTLADIARTHPDQYNNQTSNIMPFPGEAVIEALGNAFTKTSDASYLITQLFENPAVNYSDETKKEISLKLQKVMETIKSISKALDKNDTSNSQKYTNG
tara:strand:+ start:10405 stop:10788 length:384 start_codon:yes stop_codon:yes gene_type:complete